MNFTGQLAKRLLIFAGGAIFLTGVISVLLRSQDQASTLPVHPDGLSLTTPTPYPLPTTAYDLRPFPTLVPGTMAPAESDTFMDPVQIKEDGQQKAENEYLDLYSVNDYLPIEIPWWQQESRQVYESVSQRLDTRLRERVIVTFAPPESGACPARGRTFRERPVIVIFADQDTTEEQILGVLAHELGHVLSFEKYKNLSDLALTEGIATWAAGDYWNRWKGFDFNSGVRKFVKDGIYLPLFENYDLEKAYDKGTSACITYRDVLYTELASFIDYLIQKYGAERLSALFDIRHSEIIDNRNIVYPPNYKDVYGLELNQLEYEWLKTLLQSNP